MNQYYEQLADLIQNDQDLNAFFKQDIDYKAILDQAINESYREAITALSENLPLDTWFNKEQVTTKFQNLLENFPFHANLFTWCMTIPEVRQCFSPKEKGQFVHVGLTLKNHQMAYHATLDNDWERKLADNVIESELERLSKNSVLKFNDNHVKMEYLEWFQTEIFPKLPEKIQFVYMLGVLNISVGQLRQISEIKDLAEIGFNVEHQVSYDKICEIQKDLKTVIFHLKRELCFDHWADIEQYRFALNNVGYIPKGAAELVNFKDLEKTADKLTTFINYKKLHNELSELPQNDVVASRKLKI
jgi:hypothetical protein